MKITKCFPLEFKECYLFLHNSVVDLRRQGEGGYPKNLTFGETSFLDGLTVRLIEIFEKKSNQVVK